MALDAGVIVSLLAYKEAENLRVLIPEIISAVNQLGVPYTIQVVDTKEALDDTPGVCREWRDKGYDVVYWNQEEPGFGGAFKTAIRKAGRELFLILDSDGSHSPAFIPSMYSTFIADHCDVVIGSRYVKGGITHDSKSSVVMSHILNTVFRIAIGIKAKDISTDFRLYRTDQLKAVKLENVNYDVLQEVLLKLKLNKRDLKIEEVPISFEKRKFGESKRRLLPFILSYIRSLFRLTWMRITAVRKK